MKVYKLEVKYEDVRMVTTGLCNSSDIARFKVLWDRDIKGNIRITPTVNIEVTYK
jgi:hypothetical protein